MEMYQEDANGTVTKVNEIQSIGELLLNCLISNTPRFYQKSIDECDHL